MDFKSILRSQWDRTGAIVASAAGLIILLVGWIGISGTPYLAEQLPYIISGGIAGLFFLGLGATLWISADLRDEWAKLDRIESALLDGSLRWTEQPASPPQVDIDRGRDGEGYRERRDTGSSEQWAPDYLDQTSEQPVVVEEAAQPARRTRTKAPVAGETVKPTTRKRASSTRRPSLVSGPTPATGVAQEPSR